MKAIYKYSGGKTREAKFLSTLAPKNFTRLVEPFAGSCAFAFHMEKPALVSDVREDVVTCLQVAKDPVKFVELQRRVEELRAISGKANLEPHFYKWRDDMWKAADPIDRAFRWIVIRQLVFSGMDRVNNKTGKENAPFAWYDNFKCNLSNLHHQLLQNWDIKLQSFDVTLDEVTAGDFVFLDPPYLERNSDYGAIAPSELMHKNLLAKLDTLKQPWLIVHNEHPTYLEFAKRHNLIEREFMYAQNFVGRNNTKSKTRHLYITNYKVS